MTDVLFHNLHVLYSSTKYRIQVPYKCMWIHVLAIIQLPRGMTYNYTTSAICVLYSFYDSHNITCTSPWRHTKYNILIPLLKGITLLHIFWSCTNSQRCTFKQLLGYIERGMYFFQLLGYIHVC